MHYPTNNVLWEVGHMVGGVIEVMARHGTVRGGAGRLRPPPPQPYPPRTLPKIGP